MGATVCDAVRAATDLELVGSFDVGYSVDDLAASGAQVVVDFTTPAAVMGNIEACVGQGKHVVVGTTGFDADRLATRCVVAEDGSEQSALSSRRTSVSVRC